MMLLFQWTQRAWTLVWCTLILIVVLIPSAQSSSPRNITAVTTTVTTTVATTVATTTVVEVKVKDSKWQHHPANYSYGMHPLPSGIISAKESSMDWEGRKRFVRIKPKSVLESLYPPWSHGPDRCLLCHHSFADHLSSWWFPNRYTPFGTWLDDTMMNHSEEVETTVADEKKEKE